MEACAIRSARIGRLTACAASKRECAMSDRENEPEAPADAAGSADAAADTETQARILIHRGEACRLRKQYDRAIADFSEAIQIDPEITDAYYCRGCAHFDKGAYVAASADFNRVLELDPKCSLAHFCLGSAHVRQG